MLVLMQLRMERLNKKYKSVRKHFQFKMKKNEEKTFSQLNRVKIFLYNKKRVKMCFAYQIAKKRKLLMENKKKSFIILEHCNQKRCKV